MQGNQPPTWREQPELMAGGMIVGLSCAWLAAFVLLLWATVPETVSLTHVGFYLLMVLPLLVGAGLCAVPAVRLWATGLVLGATLGWSLGLVSLAALDVMRAAIT